jgi:tetratricopeptide (TPR) repeat protein
MSKLGRVLGAWLSLVTFSFCLAPAAEPTAESEREESLSGGDDSPRALFEAVILATVRRDAAGAALAQSRLVLEHPSSLYADYVVATFAKPQDYRKLLKDEFTRRHKEIEIRFAKSFCRAVQLGCNWFGNEFLSDEDFVVLCALAAYEARDFPLEVWCRNKLSESKNEAFRGIASTVFDNSLTTIQQVCQLHAIEHKSAALFRQHLMGKLNEAERETPEIVRVEAEMLLEEGAFDKALPVVDKLLVLEETPQLLFWRLWCLAALGRYEEAKAAIESLGQKAPHDPWTDCATEFGESLDAWEDNLSASVGLVLAAVDRLRNPATNSFEGTAVYTADDGRTISVYVAVAFDRAHFELMIRQNDRVMLAYRASEGRGRIYCDGDLTIQEFQRNAVYPVGSINVVPHEDGFRYFYNANISSAPNALSESRERIRIAPALLTPEKMTQMLRGPLLAKGNFPAAVVRERDGDRVTLLRAEARRPKLRRTEIQFSPDAMLTRVDFGQWTCKDLQYGSCESIALSPPRWPELPVTSRDDLEVATLFRLFAAVTSMFQSPQAAVASTAPPERR